MPQTKGSKDRAGDLQPTFRPLTQFLILLCFILACVSNTCYRPSSDNSCIWKYTQAKCCCRPHIANFPNYANPMWVPAMLTSSCSPKFSTMGLKKISLIAKSAFGASPSSIAWFAMATNPVLCQRGQAHGYQARPQVWQNSWPQLDWNVRMFIDYSSWVRI